MILRADHVLAKRTGACFISVGLVLMYLGTTNIALAQGREREVVHLTLDQAIRIGVANSFALKAVGNRQAAVRALIRERWRNYLPDVGVSLSRTRTINEGEVDSVRNEVRLNVQQVIFDGGRREMNLEMAKLDALLSQDDFKIAFNQIRLDVQRAYLRALAARGKIALNQKSLSRARLQLRQARVEERVGVATRVQTLTVAARMREVELALQRSINEYRQSIHALKQALNLDFEVQIEIEGDLFKDFFLLPPSADLEELVQRARSERPEIRRALAGVHRLRRELELNENAWIPQVSVGGYVGRAMDSLPPRDRSWGVNITVTFPLGSHQSTTNAGLDVNREGATRSGGTQSDLQFFEDIGYDRRVLESRTALAEAMSEQGQLYNSIAIEVNRAYDALREAWEAIRIGNGRVYFQYAGLRIQETRFRVGESRRADILQAELEMVSAQEDLTDSVAEYILASQALEFSAAMDPGALGLTVQQPGNGNTLLNFLLSGDLDQMRRTIQQQSTPEEVRQRYLEDDRALEVEPGDERYLIDEVPLEDDP